MYPSAVEAVVPFTAAAGALAATTNLLSTFFQAERRFRSCYLALALGLVFTFALPVQTALVPKLVPDTDTEATMAMNSVSYNAGRALAPALCVLLVAASGFAWAFALNALSFLLYAAALMRVRPLSGARPGLPARARDGARTALQQPRILLLLAMVAAVTFADDPVLILGPVLARQLTGAGPGWAGYFLSALGLGTVLGSLHPARAAAPNPSRSSRRAAFSLLALVACVGVFAAGISTWVSLGAAFGAGAAALRTGAVTQTQLVRQRPERTASVMALWAIAWAGTKPVASLADGWLAGHGGVIWAAVILGVPAAALGLAEIFLPAAGKAWLKDRARRFGGREPDGGRQAGRCAAWPLRRAVAGAGSKATRVIIVSDGKGSIFRERSSISGLTSPPAGVPFRAEIPVNYPEVRLRYPPNPSDPQVPGADLTC